MPSHWPITVYTGSNESLETYFRRSNNGDGKGSEGPYSNVLFTTIDYIFRSITIYTWAKWVFQIGKLHLIHIHHKAFRNANIELIKKS